MNSLQIETIQYDVANFLINLESYTHIHDLLSCFWHKGNGKFKIAKINIKIETECNNQNFYNLCKEFNQKRKTLNSFKLKAYELFFDKSADCYYMIGKNIFGKYSQNQETVVWYINEKSFFSRNIFHICVLDILCLAAPKYNNLVFHGAVIHKNFFGYMFIGNSGSGKSTVSYRLSSQTGFSKACDDVFIIDLNSTPYLYPINTGNGYIINSSEEIINKENNLKLYETNNKIYFSDKRTKPIKLSPRYVFVLDRKKGESNENTEIKDISPDSLLRLIIARQANIPSIYTKKRFYLLKKFCSIISANHIIFSGDCNINSILERMCLFE